MDNLWQDLLGEPPETSESRPREHVVVQGGEHEGAWLALEARPERVDWRLAQKPNQPPALPPSLGPFEQAVPSFKALMLKGLKKSPRLMRLAFGAILLLPADSRHDGYRRLDDLLPGIKVDPNSTDFSYRINRRRPSDSGIKGLEINRLSTWSVAHMRSLSLHVSGDTPRIQGLQDAFHACRLELDINTAPDFGRPINKNAIGRVLSELIDLGSEIAMEGDVP